MSSNQWTIGMETFTWENDGTVSVWASCGLDVFIGRRENGWHGAAKLEKNAVRFSTLEAAQNASHFFLATANV